MISTACNGCSFASIVDGRQVECELGILQRMEEAGATLSTFEHDGVVYRKVNRVCMYRRYNRDDTTDIYDEVFIRSNIVVLHTDQSIHDLKITLESIAKLDTPKPPRVIVCHIANEIGEVYDLGTSLIPKQDFVCVKFIEEMYVDSIYDEAFRRSRNGWVFFIKSGVSLKDDTVRVLNHAINYNMLNLVATSGIEVYHAAVFKYLRGFRGGSIQEKLLSEGADIVDWEELNDAYRLYIDEVNRV